MSEEAKHTYPKHHVGRAKSLRANSTKAETILWKELQTLKTSMGLKFRRQQPIDRYIVNFICPLARLIVEIDGLSHDGKHISDEKRMAYLKKQNFHVLRFTDGEVLQNLEVMMAVIARECATQIKTTHTNPSPNPLPQGEGA